MIKITKRIFSALVISIILFLLGGGITQGVSAMNSDVLTLSPTSFVGGNGGGTRIITVTSNGTWSNPTVSANATSWLSIENVNPTNRRGNGSFRVRWQSNPGAQERSGTITVRQGNITRTVNVTQLGRPATLTLSPTSWNAPSGGGNTTINVTSNTTWNAPTSNAPSWLTVSNITPANRTGNGSFRLNATANNTGVARTGTITVTGGGLTRQVTVTQQPATLTLSPTSWNAPQGGGNTTINVTSNITWNTPTSNAPSWLTVSNITPANRTGNGSFRLNATANNTGVARTGTITVTGGGLTRQVTVTQQSQALTLTLSTNNEILRPTATTTANRPTIIVTSNTTWSMPTSNVSWLTISNVSPFSRTGNGSFIIDATANTGAQRTGTITVTGGGITRTVSVTQIGAQTLSLSPTSVTLGRGSSHATIQVTSTTWQEPVTHANWLTISHVTPANRMGNGSFRINATANTGERREATVVVRGSTGLYQVVRVIQEAGAISLTTCRNLIHLAARANGTVINVTSNATWSVPASDSNWLTVSQILPANRTGNGTFRIDASENNTGDDRSGEITITASGITRTINVWQGRAAGLPTLTLSRTSLALGSRASYHTINVTSDATWSMPVSNVPWLTVSHILPANRIGNGSFRINVATNSNPEIDREGTITVSAGGRTQTITIRQHRYYIWHSDLSIVGFWPGAVNTSVQTHGNVGRNMNIFLDNVNREWATALGVPINRTAPAQANIQNHVGRRGPLAAFMRTQRYHIAVSANTICTGRYQGLAFNAPTTWAGSIVCREGRLRSVQRYSGVAVTFNSYDNRFDNPINDVNLQNLLLHEMGHALGWEGHSRTPGDVMYIRGSHNVIRLSPQEARHLRQIYNAFR